MRASQMQMVLSLEAVRKYGEAAEAPNPSTSSAVTGPSWPLRKCATALPAPALGSVRLAARSLPPLSTSCRTGWLEGPSYRSWDEKDDDESAGRAKDATGSSKNRRTLTARPGECACT